jgi:regulator of sirC expression with transglutaminase-like and TPR domain
MNNWAFRDELQLEEINVPRAALQFARALAYPELDVAAYMLMLHELSEEASARIAPARSILSQAECLSEFLFAEMGFRGNTAEYNDPRNSFLNGVLDRRLGIPITLSVVYVDIAARLGIPAYGIGLPGHFIVGVHDLDADIWLDPFHGGRRLDLADCAELICIAAGYEGPLEASWFAPITARNTLARMLGNLRASYVAAAAWSRAADVIDLLRQTQPEETEHLRDLGLVYYHQRRLPQAAHFLDAYLHRAPDAADAQVIRDGMKPLLDAWVPMN